MPATDYFDMLVRSFSAQEPTINPSGSAGELLLRKWKYYSHILSSRSLGNSLKVMVMTGWSCLSKNFDFQRIFWSES